LEMAPTVRLELPLTMGWRRQACAGRRGSAGQAARARGEVALNLYRRVGRRVWRARHGRRAGEGRGPCREAHGQGDVAFGLDGIWRASGWAERKWVGPSGSALKDRICFFSFLISWNYFSMRKQFQ
jgi:hypothetical protein